MVLPAAETQQWIRTDVLGCHWHNLSWVWDSHPSWHHYLLEAVVWIYIQQFHRSCICPAYDHWSLPLPEQFSAAEYSAGDNCPKYSTAMIKIIRFPQFYCFWVSPFEAFPPGFVRTTWTKSIFTRFLVNTPGIVNNLLYWKRKNTLGYEVTETEFLLCSWIHTAASSSDRFVDFIGKAISKCLTKNWKFPSSFHSLLATSFQSLLHVSWLPLAMFFALLLAMLSFNRNKPTRKKKNNYIRIETT